MPRRDLNHEPTSRINRETNGDELIVIMKEEDDLREQREILEAMNPKLKEKFDQIRNLLESEVHNVLRNRYDLGEHFQALYDDETDNGSKSYGKHAVDKICRLLAIDRTLVRGCMKFVSVYSRDDLEMLCTRLLPRGEHISWSHMRALAHVEDTSRREELLEKTFDEGWTCNELADAAKRNNDRDGNNSGRPPRIPSSFDGMVAQQKKATEDWERKNSKVWNHPHHSLVVKADELADDEVTEARLKEASELAYHLRGLAEEANLAAKRAEVVVRRFQDILDQRKRSQEPQDEATEDEEVNDCEPKEEEASAKRKPKGGKRKHAASAR